MILVKISPLQYAYRHRELYSSHTRTHMAVGIRTVHIYKPSNSANKNAEIRFSAFHFSIVCTDMDTLAAPKNENMNPSFRSMYSQLLIPRLGIMKLSFKSV